MYDFVLTISGTGDMWDWTVPEWDLGDNESPWVENESIKAVEIEQGVTSIGDQAFLYCEYLSSITVPESVTSIGISAFYNCIRLRSITIPDGVTSIGLATFWGCGLRSITIPDIKSKNGTK